MVFGWKMKKMDVVSAFLNSKLKEEVWLKIPEGWKEVTGKDTEGKVAKLNAVIYGLTQAARAFYDMVREFLTKEHEMRATKADACLLIGKNLIVGLYVDDFWYVVNKTQFFGSPTS